MRGGLLLELQAVPAPAPSASLRNVLEFRLTHGSALRNYRRKIDRRLAAIQHEKMTEATPAIALAAAAEELVSLARQRSHSI